jgi:hypothetical protein
VLVGIVYAHDVLQALSVLYYWRPFINLVASWGQTAKPCQESVKRVTEVCPGRNSISRGVENAAGDGFETKIQSKSLGSEKSAEVNYSTAAEMQLFLRI